MSAILVRDLPASRPLDRRAMSAVRGGHSALAAHAAKFGPFANVNVNVGVSQSIVQLQDVEVNALNNVGVIGADLGLKLNVSPKQHALANVVF